MARVLTPEQKAQRSAYYKAWRSRNADRCKEYESRRYRDKPERREQASAWRKRHPERSKATARRWYAKNPGYKPPSWNRAKYKNSILKRLYGITLQQFEEMKNLQGYVCALCKEQPAKVVDHCHTTGKVRGILCALCNCALGALRDRPDLCSKAGEYLQQTKALPKALAAMGR